MTGRIIQGRFEILDEVGRGGMGVVYRARQLKLDRVVALKMLSDNLVDDKEFRDRFTQEAKIIARLSHPNVVQVYDIYDIEGEEGGFCIVMEYIDGSSLRDVLREANGRLPVERSASIARQVAAGLGYAHKQGIIHRDIKPDNVMMLPGDHVKIMDFGIARLRGSTVHTQTGVSMGTPQFMSPEQAAGRSVDARSDLYSLSVVLYSMVAGELPFSGDSPVEIALKHIQEPARRPSDINAAIPPGLDSIILRGIAKKPSDRYQSAEQYCAVLDRFCTGEEVVAASEGDDTYVSAPVSPTPVGEMPWEAAAVESAPAESVASQAAAATPPRRFNWPWIIAFLPGILALIIVIAIGIQSNNRNRIPRKDLESIPLRELFPRMMRLPPDELSSLIKEHEDILFERVKNEGRGRQAYMTWFWVGQVILPYVDDDPSNRWRTLLPSRRSRPRLPLEQIQIQLRRLDERTPPNPIRARMAFSSATAALKRIESDEEPTSRSEFSLIALKGLIDSVRYDRENGKHNLRLAEWLIETLIERYRNMELPMRGQLFRAIQSLVVQARRKCPKEDRERIARVQERLDGVAVAWGIRNRSGPRPPSMGGAPNRGPGPGPDRDRDPDMRNRIRDRRGFPGGGRGPGGPLRRGPGDRGTPTPAKQP